MVQLAYLPPVGPFAGLSKAARDKVRAEFPLLPLAEIERAAERFCVELQSPTTNRRLWEVREVLSGLREELSGLQNVIESVRKHQLQFALAEASRMISGEDDFEHLTLSLKNLQTASLRALRALPVGSAQLASRNLIETLACYIPEARPPRNAIASASLVSLVNVLFEDLMIGAEAQSAVADWKVGQSASPDHNQTCTLIDLLVSSSTRK